MDKLLRLILIGIIGYLFGYVLGVTIARADTNEQLHLNSLNTVTFRGEVNENSTTQAQLELNALVVKRGSKTYPIYLVIDSPGGEIMAGLSFIEVVKNVPNLKTVSIFAASMASGFVQSLPGSRLITGNGVLMFHRAAGGVSGQFEVGELETRLELYKTIVRGLETINAIRLGISLVEYKSRVVNEYWLTAKKAIDDKAADKIVDIVCSSELIDKRVTSTIESFFSSSEVTHSGCPTFRYPVSSKASGL